MAINRNLTAEEIEKLAQLSTGDNNFNATAAPTVNDDNTEGYEVGSIWIDTTNDKAYILLDASTGSAVWVDITEQAGNPIDLDATATIDDIVTDLDGANHLVVGMTITPASGTYRVTFSSSGFFNGGNRTMDYSIFAAGLSDSASVRHVGTDGGQTAGVKYTLFTTAKVTVNGSQAIEVKATVNGIGGQFTFNERSLTIIKVQ